MVELTYLTQLEMSQSLRYYHDLVNYMSFHKQVKSLVSPVQNMLIIASYTLSMSISSSHCVAITITIIADHGAIYSNDGIWVTVKEKRKSLGRESIKTEVSPL